MRSSPLVATAHAWLTVVVGVFLAATGNVRRIVCVCAYIAACEVLWRMSDALIFWETGKLLVALLIGVSIVRLGLVARGGIAPLYFLLLLPSAMATFASVPLDWARQEISFNMTGPFVLMACTWFFHNVQWDGEDMTWVFLSMILPIITTSLVGVHFMATHDMMFGSGSNSVTSGGFGPNQVSVILGLGAYLCFLLLTLSPYRSNLVFTIAMGVGLLGLAAHSAITFSRGGLYSLASGALGSSLFLLATPKARIRLILAVVAFVVVGGFYILPRMDKFTSGALMHRLEDSRTTGRDKLMEFDWLCFQRNPIFGVGPGKVTLLMEGAVDNRIVAHTEITRLPAEHGIFGVAALLILGLIALQNIRRNNTTSGKAISVGLMLWVLMTMLHAAMRLAAPGFIFGLAAAKLLPDSTEPPKNR